MALFDVTTHVTCGGDSLNRMMNGRGNFARNIGLTTTIRAPTENRTRIINGAYVFRSATILSAAADKFAVELFG